MCHDPDEWPQETANLRIEVEIVFGDTRRKLDEQFAELLKVLPTHFRVDEERTDEAQRRLFVPTPYKFQEARSRLGAAGMVPQPVSEEV